ncbi:delta tubulin [Volvox carteri f. nagariensis]|uniref:Tubulin delta chain n=1 Tax=Volvox carteri f. nagariensis TaxID=3068 RepID=D8TV44_VOLCA|nr:delta tubulin [Volvox carteri f. nagariensis]EFJ48639.1 delta tubulin [Volvox carteri f. nagariensis]|eukprot:XP_002950438.1 delta tubulin [Volvox carteri f. nagariensis]
MPVITLQLGQCGNQLGCSFFSTLAGELSANDYGFDAVNEYYRAGPDTAGLYTARSVLIDMEPKVVAGARASAAASGSWWRYSSSGYLVMQSGSGNNWAQGFHGYGPRVHEAALELVRREVEAADSLTGFLLLQSMAGGTGAGLGTYVAQALRDEYHSAFITNCCVWPYESGEVIVQPYNTLFTLSHLSDLSDGIVLLENEALHLTCARLMGIPRPSFADMNGIAARAMASVLLPSRLRGPTNSSTTSPLADLVTQLCPHPAYRMLTLRAIPQLPPASIDFTTFTWPAILKRLRQMLVTGSVLEEGMDWSINPHSPAGARGTGATCGSSPRVNRAVANWLVLRGQGAGDVDVGEFADPALTSAWTVDPLSVSYNPAKFGRCLMSASLLSNDRRCVGPIERMQECAYGMLASRAFVHQYEAYGMSISDFTACFARIEDIAQRYVRL